MSLFGSFCFILHREDLPCWCGSAQHGAGIFPSAASQALLAGAEALATCILASRQPVLSSTEDGNLGVSQGSLPQKEECMRQSLRVMD